MADINNDIEKYLKGELTSAEMHALEKKALNDPFLADALEGGASLPQTDFTEDIKALQTKLNERIQSTNRKVIPLWPLAGRIAAGLLVLVISGYIIFSVLNTQEKITELALNKPIVSPAPPLVQNKVKENATRQEEPHSSLDVKDDATFEKQESPKSFSSTPPPPIMRQRETDQAPMMEPMEPTQQEQIVREEEVQGVDNLNKNTDLDEVGRKDVPLQPPGPDEKRELKDKKSEKSDSRASGFAMSRVAKSAERTVTKIIHGVVTDADDGQPLPGVNVLIKGTNAGVVTDAEGRYQIPLEDTNTELVFSFIGMQAIDVPVANKEDLNVKMNEEVAQLSEVVVVGYASKENEIEKEEDLSIYQLAEPGGGRKAFKKYLIDNMRYPEHAIENKIQGKVTIQFTVEQSGSVDDFKILKGIGYGCDEEVMRLIRQGPKWTPTKRNSEPLKGKVKVRLRFQLPE